MNVVITGGSRGLGKAVAKKFAANGYNLFLSSKNDHTLYNTLSDLTQEFPSVTIKAKAFDVGKKTDAIALGEWVLSQASSVDIVVNNAGSFQPGSIGTEADGVFEEMISVNVASAYHLTRTLLPAMIKQKSGHVFNMCSVASLDAYPQGGSYSISKFALAGFSKNLREELRPTGVKVTALYPGAVYTDSWIGSGFGPERMMTPADIADLIYTCSKLSPAACPEEIVLRPQLGDI